MQDDHEFFGELCGSNYDRGDSALRQGVDIRRIGLAALATIAIAGALILVLRPEPLPVAARREPAATMTMLLNGSPFGARFAGEMIDRGRVRLPRASCSRRWTSSDPDAVADSLPAERAIGVTSGQKFLLGAWRGIPE